MIERNNVENIHTIRLFSLVKCIFSVSFPHKDTLNKNLNSIRLSFDNLFINIVCINSYTAGQALTLPFNFLIIVF